jgi:hypothetical protein
VVAAGDWGGLLTAGGEQSSPAGGLLAEGGGRSCAVASSVTSVTLVLGRP